MKVRQGALALAVAAWLAAGPASAAAPWPTLNLYGEPGLLQTPSARAPAEGEFAVGISASHPYNRLFLSHQPLPWLAATFRYTEITNRRYGAEEFSGSQSYKDRSFDLRFNLLREGPYWPALALGLRDFGGTSLFGAEYLVASRRWYDFDFSLGLGWGRLGAGGELSNPLGGGERIGSNGQPNAANLFSGERIGVFGGVAWRTPLRGLMLLLERDANDYRNEPLNNPQPLRSPVNLGLVYKPRPWFEATLGWERGDTLSGRLAFYTNFATERGLDKLMDPPLPRAGAQPAAEGFPHRLKSALAAQEIPVNAAALSADGSVAVAAVEAGPYPNPATVAQRTALALAAAAPPSVERLAVRQSAGGMPLYETRVARAELDGNGSAAVATAGWRDAPLDMLDGLDAAALREYPDFRWEMAPALRQHIGGPDGFYLGQLWWRLGGDLALAPNVELSSSLGFNIYNNFDRLRLRSDSELPHVRSDVGLYLKEGETALVRLEANGFRALARGLYGRVSAGMFEEMYGGVAAEVLYRPLLERWAVGANVNRVRQRDYDQRFDFRDYAVTTGHLTAYYRWPQPALLFKLSAGRYLAGDEGATLDIARLYSNGIRVGAFATKTNVSSERFGEGSFDKGIYLYIPFDLLLPKSTRQGGTLMFRPLTRDGGQMVRDGKALFTVTEDLGKLQ